MGRESKGRLKARGDPTKSVKVRLDSNTAQKLEECAEILEVPKAEVLRRGVHRVHDDLQDEINGENDE